MSDRFFSHMFGDVVRDYGQPAMLWQAGVLLVTLLLAWVLARVLRRYLDLRRQTRYEALRFGAESLNRAFFPLIGAVLVWLARAITSPFMHTALLNLALVPLFGIGLIYIVFFFARRVFGRYGENQTWLSLVERLVSLMVWIGMVLTVMGIQDDVLAWMGSVHFRIANTHLSLLSLFSGVLWVGVTMIVAMWLGSAFEDRVMRASSLDANLKVVLARLGRALLVVVAVLVSLSLVGIDIRVLGVFGGALGVGLGFGLQKIASNYVSGFIILLDRSLRIGDTINVSSLQGMVTQIRTRYTVVRGLDGVETLIPNEKLITDVVQNRSSFQTQGYAKVAVQVAYETDLPQAMALLVEATQDVPRILQEPAPAPYLVDFGSDGIDLELGFWIEDAATGTVSVRSAVNLNIWRLFAKHEISIPFAQREVRILNAGGILPQNDGADASLAAPPRGA
ncbi:mechanosensitive ion channel family protein [Paraburkholderia hayleyella]|uniref:mechanosensitive ion channel family protein n=1 Tax=Paraburkholderia hayleyella TaxID=2152889 RepID=UPI0012922609|nr:mechanosensitive ion channel domain-containing protein [Paraburkholderia hayleyella]